MSRRIKNSQRYNRIVRLRRSLGGNKYFVVWIIRLDGAEDE